MEGGMDPGGGTGGKPGGGMPEQKIIRDFSTERHLIAQIRAGPDTYEDSKMLAHFGPISAQAQIRQLLKVD